MREWINRYDDEGSEARSLGSVSVSAGAWWSVALTVPGGAAEPARDTTIVRFQRHGPRSDEDRGDEGLELVLPSQEVGALVTLLAGVVAQARRDGVLPALRP